MKFLKKAALLLLITYVWLLGYLYFNQRNVLYHPPDYRVADDSLTDNWQKKTFQIEKDLTLEALFSKPSKPNMPVIIYYHGNASNIFYAMLKMETYRSQGYGVFLGEYRGYSKNSGKTTEQDLYKDARFYLKWLQDKYRIEPDQIVLYGESLGSGVAVQMATEIKPLALILEVPFSSVVDVAAYHYSFIPFLNYLIKDKFENIRKIQNVNTNVFIALSGKDEVIPVAYGKKLYEQANEPKMLKIYEKANHNNQEQFGLSNDIFNFLKSL